MSIITCGLAGEGSYAAVIPFATNPYLTVFATDIVEDTFKVENKEVEFSAAITVVEFKIDIIKIEECLWPAV